MVDVDVSPRHACWAADRRSARLVNTVTRSAGAADADDREVRQVSLETVALAKMNVERPELIDVDLALRAAPTTDHVLVVRVFGEVVDGDTVVEVGVRHESEVLKQLQGSVDRRDVDLRKLRSHPGVDRLGGHVPIGRFDRLENELPLRCETVSTLLERLHQLTHRRPPIPCIRYHAWERAINTRRQETGGARIAYYERCVI